MLSRIPVEQLDAEIGGCRARLREKLGVAATTFCYPNGMPGDVSAQARAAVERAGYTCAVVAHSNYARSVDPFRIERIAVGSSERYFNEAVYGVDYARTPMALRAVPVPQPALR